MLTVLSAAAGAATGAASSNVGEAIYRRGVLGSGKPIEASRDGITRLQGAAVACVNCHRRSGLGSKEGRSFTPPIAGRYLFHPRTASLEEMDLPYVEGMRADRDPYTDETLRRAIRDGLDSQGRPMSYLMPRFAINDTDMAALVVYLKSLDRRMVPGVTDTELHFATIITPDADPVKRRGMLDVMERFFADRNATQRVPTPRLLSSGKNAYSKTMFKVYRRWELHVWELSGPESTWQAQLESKLAAQPVFAVISGLGGKNWAPVHAFCEREALPCLFPNVEAPPADADRNFYSLYFSRGVLLEAELIAKGILDAKGGPTVKRVVQVYRSGDSGGAGAEALAPLLRRRNVSVSSRVLARDTTGEGVAKSLRDLSATDAVVFWLRPADLAALGDAPPARVAVYMSGLMGGLERAPLPPNWRGQTHMAYPVDLSERRRVRVDYALGWFRIRHIPLVADQVQADTYLACGLLAETLKHMVDTFVREYLVERVEGMVEHRVVTGYYPRLTLGSGQRFASKGGYLVHFSESAGTRLVAEGEWTVP
jgi:mono/diheme cytochrome c family protein